MKPEKKTYSFNFITEPMNCKYKMINSRIKILKTNKIVEWPLRLKMTLMRPL